MYVHVYHWYQNGAMVVCYQWYQLVCYAMQALLLLNMACINIYRYAMHKQQNTPPCLLPIGSLGRGPQQGATAWWICRFLEILGLVQQRSIQYVKYVGHIFHIPFFL